MQQLLILSGKGGTGKTTVAAALIRLFQAKAYADCDVDAPNLHIVTKLPTPIVKYYFGLEKAIIEQDKCIKCNLCYEKCRFGAINKESIYTVNTTSCEGCAVCYEVCPTKAITMHKAVAGSTMLYKDENIFSTAKLKMGNGTSGKLVTEVKKQLLENANEPLAIIDGSPGIGCPVIASLSGASVVLIVAEPSISGISDMDRIIKTAKYFDCKLAVIINKYDANIGITNQIVEYLELMDIPFLGLIPYDINAVKAINENKSIIDIECDAKIALVEVFNNLVKLIKEEV